MKREFALNGQPIAYIVTINYSNWKQYLKSQGKKSITVKKLLESGYAKAHPIKRNYENLCLTYGTDTINHILESLYGIKAKDKANAA